MKQLSNKKIVCLAYNNRLLCCFMVSLLFFLSRLLFFNLQPVFFDTPEYLVRLNNPSLLAALASGHPPFHAGYILIFWPLVHLTKYFSINPVLIVEIFTVILGFFSIFFFYRLAEKLFGRPVAWWSSLLMALLPYFWITNVSVMIETSYVFFFILSLYLFNQYLNSEKKKTLFLSAFVFGFAYFIHTLVIIWLPAFISVWLLNKKVKKNFTFSVFISEFIRKRTLFILIFAFCILIYYLINVFLLYHSQIFKLQEAFIFGLVGKTNEHLSFFPLMTLIPRLIRNWFLLLSRSNTNLLLILFFMSLFWCWRKGQKKIFWSIILWFFPSFIANQWWDSVLLGRHALLASFPLCLLLSSPTQYRSGIGNLLTIKEKWRILIILYLLISSLSALILLRQPIPYLKLAKTTSQLPQNALLLETHFARPYTHFSGQTIFVNEPGWPKDNLTAIIDQKLQSGQVVFATSPALADPYGLYCGPFLHPLGLNPKGQPELKFIFDQYHFEKIKTINEKKRLVIYQIKPKSTPDNFYRDFSVPYFARERIDYFDPLTQIWLFLVKSLT